MKSQATKKAQKDKKPSKIASGKATRTAAKLCSSKGGELDGAYGGRACFNSAPALDFS
jgi:hypothetical protein